MSRTSRRHDATKKNGHNKAQEAQDPEAAVRTVGHNGILFQRKYWNGPKLKEWVGKEVLVFIHTDGLLQVFDRKANFICAAPERCSDYDLNFSESSSSVTSATSCSKTNASLQEQTERTENTQRRMAHQKVIELLAFVDEIPRSSSIPNIRRSIQRRLHDISSILCVSPSSSTRRCKK